MISSEALAEQWLTNAPLLDQSLDLEMGYCSCRIESNSHALLEKLADYFSFIVKPVQQATFTIQVIEAETVQLPFTFVDWKREPGKTGKKDSYIELDNARVVRKVRTGMVFLQSQHAQIAIGPCIENDNQVINFITSQMMNWLQQRDWLICHAAAIVYLGKTLAVAGFSGGGKSSLMLAMLETKYTQFLTNDRLFIRAIDDAVDAAGIPKMPRINPGTIVHNPRLQSLIPEPQRSELLALPNETLWQLEDKYDADIERFYGNERIQYEAPFYALLILNWSRDSSMPVELKEVDLKQRPELLAAVMKSPGPFYQSVSGAFITDEYVGSSESYLAVLEKVHVYEATGRVDFKALAELYLAVVS